METMIKREFGSTGWQVTPVSFGAMRITANAAGVSEELLYALESGINFIDTARNYGDSEHIVGRTLKQWKGERPFIASKVKPRDTTNWRHYVPLEKQYTPASIRGSVETSLRTLGVDCIDLMQLHQWYYLWSHQAEWLDTLKQLQAEGKIRAIGVSAQDHEHDALLGLIEHNAVDAVQLVLNAFESRPYVSVLPLCALRKVGSIARCVFDHSGCLADGGDRERLTNDVKLSNASPEIVTEYLARIERLAELAAAAGIPLAELSIRFALNHPGVSTIAASLANVAQVDTAVTAAVKGALPEDVLRAVLRDHVWVKNFYYFSKQTVDGNPQGATDKLT